MCRNTPRSKVGGTERGRGGGGDEGAGIGEARQGNEFCSIYASLAANHAQSVAIGMEN